MPIKSSLTTRTNQLKSIQNAGCAVFIDIPLQSCTCTYGTVSVTLSKTDEDMAYIKTYFIFL